MENIHATDEEGFIPFIHNYCDRWCEECRFIAQCRVGIEELDAEEGGFKQRDEKEALKETGQNLAKALGMLHQLAKEQGVDLDALSADTPENRDLERKRTERREKVRGHPLAKVTMDHSVALHKWISAHAAEVKPVLLGYAKQAELGIEPETQLAKAQLLSRSWELIHRYSLPISSKTNRALMGHHEEPDYAAFDMDPLQSDWNGSAKMALIHVESSITAWADVLELVPVLTDTALPLLAQLKRIHAMLEREFPDARKFVRPGFDA